MIATLPASNEALCEETLRVCQALSLSPYRSLRSLTCEVVRGKLVLRGTVATYYLKQLAQSVALKSSSNLDVCNQISVSS